MDIITREDPLVKWREKKRKNLFIARKMCDAGFEDRGKRMMFCGTFLTRSKCPECGRSTISSANLCRDRLCPTCGWRLSLRKFSEMCATLQSMTDINDYQAGFLTLTVKNCKPENLRYTIEKFSEDWNRFLAQRSIKPLLWGWARSLEITYNSKTKEFHPHYHVIVLTKNKYDQNFLQMFFKIRWQASARLPYEPITDYRAIGAKENARADIDEDRFVKAILETYKYSVKSDDVEQMPLDIFRQFVSAISGIRFCSYGGSIKKARRELGFKEKEEPEEEKPQIKCTCGSEMLQEVLQWSFTEGEYKTLRQMLAAV